MCTWWRQHNHQQEKVRVADMRDCHLRHQMCLGTPWEDIHLHDGANTRHRLLQHTSTRCKGDIVGEAMHAYLLPRT
jgi:hypothetical protein